jgi:hypothetical protein
MYGFAAARRDRRCRDGLVRSATRLAGAVQVACEKDPAADDVAHQLVAIAYFAILVADRCALSIEDPDSLIEQAWSTLVDAIFG